MEFFKLRKDNLIDDKEYIEKFNELVLEKLNSKDVYKDLEYLAKREDIVLLCYEKPNEFCHRHLVLKWLLENGYEVKGELQNGKAY